jgi:hypothetical protein
MKLSAIEYRLALAFQSPGQQKAAFATKMNSGIRDLARSLPYYRVKVEKDE